VRDVKWTVNWQEYYDAEGPKEVKAYQDSLHHGVDLVDPKDLIGKRIVSVEVDEFGELVFETE
jgi:hypothetical protein